MDVMVLDGKEGRYMAKDILSDIILEIEKKG